MHWFIEPVWQNYSSMYREATTAGEARTGMEVAHHRMAALYFGISALESFLNCEMRDHFLSVGKSQDEIYEVLRRGVLKEKIKEWPARITGSEMRLRSDSIDKLLAFNSLRGELTHQKNFWPVAYEELSSADPLALVDLVAEFMVEFFRSKGQLFPYWIFGWNYLNPRYDSHEIILVNNVQFMHSVGYLGWRPKAGRSSSFEGCQSELFSDFAAYEVVVKFLRSSQRCEQKIDQFPYQPKLCRRWWDPVHQRSCGNVSQEAIRRAIEADENYVSSRRGSRDPG